MQNCHHMGAVDPMDERAVRLSDEEENAIGRLPKIIRLSNTHSSRNRCQVSVECPSNTEDDDERAARTSDDDEQAADMYGNDDEGSAITDDDDEEGAAITDDDDDEGAAITDDDEEGVAVGTDYGGV